MNKTSKRSSSRQAAPTDAPVRAFAYQVAAALARPLPSRASLGAAIATVQRRESLTVEQAVEALRLLMTGTAPAEEIAALLVGLHEKGETVEEIAAFALAMRAAAVAVRPVVRGVLADTCGTGGDRSKTFNVSTAAALVLASAGVAVAKHGNRALTSSCGSADVLEALGACIDLEPLAVERCIEQAGIGFLFAPRFHQATKHVQVVRRRLPHKTIFNLLGPLTNPAPVDVQLVGVYDERLVEPIAAVLRLIGRKRALVVHGRVEPEAGGMDECSLSGPTVMALLEASGVICRLTVTPEEAGCSRAGIEQLAGGNAAINAAVIEAVLRGEERGARRELVLLNSAAALWAAGAAPDLVAGTRRAAELIDSGAAYRKLQQFIRVTQEENSVERRADSVE